MVSIYVRNLLPKRRQRPRGRTKEVDQRLVTAAIQRENLDD
ncbi:hypothetical protein [Paenibacillus sp. IHBB 3054]